MAVDEAQRIDALHRLAVLDSAPEPAFDAIAALAAQVCGVPIALISLVDSDRQWFKANIGLPEVAQTSRTHAFCDHSIRSDELLQVTDATRDPRFAGNPYVVGEPSIRFYAGAPLVMPGGERMGTLCVIDRQPRKLDANQLSTLKSLAHIASISLLERAKRVETTARLAASEAQYRGIVEDQSELISVSDAEGRLTFVNGAYARQFGRTPSKMIGESLYDFVDERDRDHARIHLSEVMAETRMVSNVYRMVSQGPRPCWVQWTNRPLLDTAGSAVGLQSVGRDITEQRVIEQALADSEQRFRLLYESTPAMLHSIDVSGKMNHVSDRWLEVMGYERAEVMGRPSYEFLAPASRVKALEVVFPAYYATGRCDRVEYQYIRKDGSLIDVLLSATLQRDAQGQPALSLAVLEDLSDNKRLNEELGRTHAQLDAIVDNVPAMLGHWGRDGQTRFANREFQSATGLPPERIVGRPLREIYDALDSTAYPVIQPHIVEVMQGRRCEFELALLTTDGLRQLRMTLIPDQPEPGVIAGFFGMAYDITGRKALELRLKDSEQRYRSLFDHLNSGFALHEIVIDDAGQPIDYKFLAMNTAFASMSNLEPAKAIGRLASQLMPQSRQHAVDWVRIFGRVALTGEPAHLEQRSELLERWYDIVAYRPAPGQFAVIAQDITKRKQAEARLQSALQERETLLKEVYHRVKNNLQVVQSLLSLQLRNLVDGPGRAALEDSVQRVRAMALVHEKLYQAGSLSSVSLADYTADLLKQIDEVNGAGGRDLRISASVVPMAMALDGAIPFGLLVTELVSNTLKHAFVHRTAGEVRVTVSLEQGVPWLQVLDNGVGLPEGFQIDSAATMGLQLASNLARQLGGQLKAESAPGGGAVFSAQLSRLQAPAAVKENE